VSFKAWHNHVEAKRCYRSKISRGGGVYQGREWPNGTNEKRGHGQVPFSEPKERKDLQFGSKEFKAVPRL
jgi:hypothetical protein